jgi:hypothetical protein
MLLPRSSSTIAICISQDPPNAFRASVRSPRSTRGLGGRRSASTVKDSLHAKTRTWRIRRMVRSVSRANGLPLFEKKMTMCRRRRCTIEAPPCSPFKPRIHKPVWMPDLDNASSSCIWRQLPNAICFSSIRSHLQIDRLALRFPKRIQNDIFSIRGVLAAVLVGEGGRKFVDIRQLDIK